VADTAELQEGNHENVSPINRSRLYDSMSGISNKKSRNLSLLPKHCCRKLSIIYLTNKGRAHNTTPFVYPQIINDKHNFLKLNLIACRVTFMKYSVPITAKHKLSPGSNLLVHLYSSWHKSFVQSIVICPDTEILIPRHSLVTFCQVHCVMLCSHFHVITYTF
jgi:hypothetical protein